ncbi:MAG TPA: ribonuclease HI family protein [Patescibacteria group bacterium]|nr:ribonuclease HI family protein [Patescibacteria group bacterium]
MTYTLYTDGGARGNPGPAAIGGVLFGENNTVIHEFQKYIGTTTNNQAEYQALLAGLEYAHKKRIKNIHCFLDSELVVKQLNREYKVKDKNLAKLFVKAWNICQTFSHITFTAVPRAKNKHADALVNKALDDYEHQ